MSAEDTAQLRSYADPKNPQNQNPIKAPELKPIDAIKKLGKKYIKLSEDKKKTAKQQLLTLSHELALSDLAPLFLTAVKKPCLLYRVQTCCWLVVVVESR